MGVTKKKKPGRPSTYAIEVSEEICSRISNGEPLRQICRDAHMPAWRTVYDWLDSDEDFAARFARARELGFDAIAEETLSIIDEEPERTNTQFGDKVDAGFVQWQKNRAEQRLKLLAKWSPDKYGDRASVELTGAGGGPVQISDAERAAKIAGLVAKAQARQQQERGQDEGEA